MIMTSNRGFGEWTEIFGDAVVATALLDRLLHHAVVIPIEGNSYRLREHAALVPETMRSRSSWLDPQGRSKTHQTPPQQTTKGATRPPHGLITHTTTGGEIYSGQSEEISTGVDSAPHGPIRP